LGCIGMVIVAIEVFGIFAAAVRRVMPVRIYAYLSILATLLILANYIIQTVIHYSFKNDIINLCASANTGDRIFFTGFFGPIDGGIVTPLEARVWCTREYDRDSFSIIVALLVVTAVAALFALFVFAYLRQLSDPTSPANVSRDPIRMGNFNYNPQPYNPSYNPPYNPPYNPLDGQHEPFNGPQKMDGSFVPPYDVKDSIPPAYDGKGGFVDQKDWSGPGR